MHEVPAETSPSQKSRLIGAVAPWWHTAVIVLLLAGTSLLSARAAHHDHVAAHHVDRYLFGICAEWLLLLLTWWGLRMKRIPMAQLLGFCPGVPALAEDFGAAAVFWIAAAIVLAVIGLLLRLAHLAAPQKTLMAIAPRTPLELLLWVMLSISAGFCEEFVFRGYFLRQFASVGRGFVDGRGVLFAALRRVSRIRGRSGNDRDHRVRRDVLRSRDCAQQSSTGNDRACVARHFQRSDARAAATFSSVVKFSCAMERRARSKAKKVVEKICIFFLTLYARNSIHSLTAAFYVADFDVDIEKGE